MEVGDEFRSVRELRCREPRGFFIRTFVTGPLNQVLELAFVSFVYLGIKDRGLYSGSPSMMTGGSATEFQPGKGFGVAGSIMETWKTGWIKHMLSGMKGE